MPEGKPSIWVRLWRAPDGPWQSGEAPVSAAEVEHFAPASKVAPLVEAARAFVGAEFPGGLEEASEFKADAKAKTLLEALEEFSA